MKTYSDPNTPAVSYCYDGNTAGACSGAPSGAGLKGRLTQVSSGDTIQRFSSFDGLGRVLASRQSTGRRMSSATPTLPAGRSLRSAILPACP